jgi:putative hydrolase of the HAD superfamily
MIPGRAKVQRFSVFLTPSGEDYVYTGNVIRELCAKYDELHFEPHVTVYAGDLSDLETLKKAVSAAAEGVPPFSLRVLRVGCREEYFKSLFIEFEENAVLRRIYERIKAGETAESGYELIPHLSLLYKEMPLLDKEAMARRVRIDRAEINFDQLKIVTPRNETVGWRDTGQWQTLFRVRLEKSSVKSPLRAVLFDFGGVLAEEGFREGLFAIARGQGLDPQELHRMAMDAIYDCGYIAGSGSEEDFWNLMRERTGIRGEVDVLSGEILRRFVLRPRMMDLVRKLRAEGIKVAIVSDQTDWLNRLDNRDNFFREFDRVFNSYDLGKGKRDAGIFDDVVATLGIAPHEAVFVDDMPANADRARARGLHAILFVDEDQLIEELERL